MDHNGTLLGAAADWITIESLGEIGVDTSPMQLRLLEDYDLIERRDNRIRRTFPALDTHSLQPLRRQLSDHAVETLVSSRSSIDSLAECLDDTGHRPFLWSIVFGYVLDGLVWDHLRGLDVLPPVDLSIEHPYWRGALWMLETSYPGSAGTNFVAADGAILVLCWTDAVSARIHELMDKPGLPALVSALPDTQDRPTEAGAAPDGLLDRHGRPAFPVVQPGDELDTIGRRLAEHTALDILAHALPRTERCYPDIDPPTRVVIAAHEYMWALTDALTGADIIQPPPALTSGEGPLLPLLFAMIDRRKPISD